MKKVDYKGLRGKGEAKQRVYHIEVTEGELQLFDRGLKKEQTHLNRMWEKCEPTTPEEVMYRALSRDETIKLREDIKKIIN